MFRLFILVWGLVFNATFNTVSVMLSLKDAGKVLV